MLKLPNQSLADNVQEWDNLFSSNRSPKRMGVEASFLESRDSIY